jgi:alpha-galactosidase
MRRAAARALLLAAAAALPGSRLLLAPYGGGGSSAISGIAAALENGLARTPPLGWSSWNRFGCDIDEALIRETADAMVARGLRDAGCDNRRTHAFR